MNSLFYAGALITFYSTMILCLGSLTGAFELNDRLRTTFLSVVNLLSVLIVAWVGFTTGYAFQTPYLQIMAVSGVLSLGMVMATIFIVSPNPVVNSNQKTLHTNTETFTKVTSSPAKAKPKPIIAEVLLKEIPVDQGGILATPSTQKEETRVLATAEN